MFILNNYIEQITKICELNNVKSLFAFGSITTDRFNSNSDIDLLVDIYDIDPLTYTDKYYNLKFQLEDLLKRQIDLLEERALKNRTLKSEIDRTKVLIYGSADKKMA